MTVDRFMRGSDPHLDELHEPCSGRTVYTVGQGVSASCDCASFGRDPMGASRKSIACCSFVCRALEAGWRP
jgi:hypothetical protein